MAGGRLGGLLAVGALAIGGCVTTGPGGTGEADTAAIAATYRYLFANNASGIKDRAATYCIGVGARPDIADPPPALLTALSDVTPKVHPASVCRVDERVVDAAGRPSLLFTLAPAGCDSPDNCLFEGGYYEANLSASHGRYRAREVDGRWQVTPEGPQAIS